MEQEQDYDYSTLSDEDLKLRCKNRADRLSRLFAVDAPWYVIESEYRLLTGAYAELERRQQRPSKPEYEGTCPRCGGLMPNARHPGQYIGALSRWDNKTYVCSDCGTDEAMLQFEASGGRNLLSADRQNLVETVVHPIIGKKLWVTPPPLV